VDADGDGADEAGAELAAGGADGDAVVVEAGLGDLGGLAIGAGLRTGS
jgi:hypothetical protein